MAKIWYKVKQTNVAHYKNMWQSYLWCYRCAVSDKLQYIVMVCGKISHNPLTDLNSVYETRTLKKTQSVLADPSHPLNSCFILLPSGRRFSLPKCRTNRHKNSFVPAAIGFFNKSLRVVDFCVVCIHFLFLTDVWLLFCIKCIIYVTCCCTTHCPPGIIKTPWTWS